VFRSFYSSTGSLIVARDTVGVLISESYQVMVQNLPINFFQLCTQQTANNYIRVAKQN
jgi:hypothetical protein